MIELKQVQFHYSDSDFSLRLPALTISSGQHTALIGPSGCGKTTLLNLMAGVLLPQQGAIQVAGQTIGELDNADRRQFRLQQLGMIFQTFELLEYLNVEDNILLPLRIGGGTGIGVKQRQRAHDVAASLGIGDKLRRYPVELSQGEKQRTAICRALLLQPKLILADEPTGNLDPSNKLLVLDLLLDYAKVSGATVVTVTHDHDLLERFEQVLDFNQLNQWSVA